MNRQIAITMNDTAIKTVFAFTVDNHISFDEMTEKLWLDFIENYHKSTVKQNHDFLTELENTRGIWQHDDGLDYQNKLREEW